MKRFCLYISYPIFYVPKSSKNPLKASLWLDLRGISVRLYDFTRTLITELIASEVLGYHPVNTDQDISGIARFIEGKKSGYKIVFELDNAAVDWHFV